MIRWDEVSLITSYKINQMIHDTIVIEIHTAETKVTIQDETPGHMKFMTIASSHLITLKKSGMSALLSQLLKPTLRSFTKEVMERNPKCEFRWNQKNCFTE